MTAVGGPTNLHEIVQNDQTGYRLGKTYFVELEHGLMGTFPAVFKGTHDPVITADIEVLKKVWALLTPRRARITEQLAYVNDSLGISARLPSYQGESFERCGAGTILTQVGFDDLVVHDPRPFEWAPGLVGSDMTRDEFAQTLEIALQRGAP